MQHLNAEELLRLADGELSGERVEHLDRCADCAAAADRYVSTLDRACAALEQTAVVETADARHASGLRLRASLQAASEAVHLTIEELLLHLDDELSVARAAHLEQCQECHDEFLRTQALLYDVTHELRALIPVETQAAKRASAARLEKSLYKGGRVLEFPALPKVAYAAAAALAVGLFGLAWQVSAPQIELAELPPPPAPAVTLSVAPVAEAPLEAAVRQAPESLESSESPAPVADRFEMVAEARVTPSDRVIARLDAPLVAAAPAATALPITWRAPSLTEPAAAPARTPATPRRSVASVAEPVAARPAGGLVRTALLEHYGDAARRSFRSPTPDLLETELARYVSNVLRSETALLREAYALRQSVEQAEMEALDEAAARELQKELKRRLRAVRENEERVYDLLSEALPRDYWAHRDRDAAAAADAPSLTAQSEALLADALALDQSLSAILVSSGASLSLEEAQASPGALLYSLRQRVRNLESSIAALR